MNAFESTKAGIADKSCAIGIIGMGYVGLPLMLAATGHGFRVLGFDIDQPKVAALNRGVSPLKHIGEARIGAALEAGLFKATTDFGRIGEVDAILICVPTPIGRHREPDLSFVIDTVSAIRPHLRPGQLIALESTTYPGTTTEVVKPIVEADGLRSEDTVFIAYSPEREDPGNLDFNTARIPKVVGGDGPKALELACRLYESFVSEVVPVSSTATAEAVKITENVFRAVNIALVNELKLAYAQMGIDVFEVIDAAKTKPFGFMAFYPGPGLGGHCIPIDPFYLTWKAREHGISTRFIELAGEINTMMPRHVVTETALALDEHLGRGLKDARVLVVGVAYKKNIDDVRESPALEIIDLLDGRGAVTSFHDPFVPALPKTRKHGHQQDRASVALNSLAAGDIDAAIVVTDHDEIDYEHLLEIAPVVIDTRGRLPADHPKVARA